MQPPQAVEAAQPPRPSLAEPFIDASDVTPGQVELQDVPLHVESDSSDVDLVLLFNLKSGGEVKHAERFTKEKFLKRMLGLRETRKGPAVNELKTVLKTPKCFVDDAGVPFKTNNGSTDSVDNKMACLAAEYKDFVGSDGNATEAAFCQLVARAVAKRLQLTCGLTVKMFKSKRGNLIIMTVKADEGDLKTEAARIEYRLQTSNKPFDAIHAAKLRAIVADEGNDASVIDASKDHLQAARCSLVPHVLGDAGEKTGAQLDQPEMDPLLLSLGKTCQPTLATALAKWGHNEVADGQFPPPRASSSFFAFLTSFCVASAPRSLWKRFVSSLIYISRDPSTYFSLYTPYQKDAMFQPYFRWYPASAKGTKEETLFRPVDRIRLTMSIVNRHLNLDVLRHYGLLNDVFALHDPTTLEMLKKEWATKVTLSAQPIGAIRDYFGEKIALYFAWLELYTKLLVLPAAFGIAIFVLDVVTTVVPSRDLKIAFAVAIVIWSTMFTELWKRKSAIYNVIWGTDHSDIQSTPRTQFVGVQRLHPVDNTPQMWIKSASKHKCKVRASFVVVFVMVLIVIVALVGLFYLKYLSARLTSPSAKQWASVGVSALNSIQIALLNKFYNGVAHWLNNWENHRTDMEHENHLINKVFLFQFCNSFASFFYIAYVKHYVNDPCVDDNCLAELRLQLIILFGLQIVTGNLIEVLMPMMQRSLALYSDKKKHHDDAQFSQEELQSMLAPYEGSDAFQDYNEMVIQYGFVTLFVVAFPLTPAMALINNMIEIHSDAFKLCSAHRRPFPHRAASIGSWDFFLNIINTLAVVTNIAILLFTHDPNDSVTTTATSSTTKWVTFVIAEQVCLVMKFVVAFVIPDEPQELTELKARHKDIEANVFLGQNATEPPSTELSEKPEKLHLVIYDSCDQASMPRPPSPVLPRPPPADMAAMPPPAPQAPPQVPELPAPAPQVHTDA
ncbi:hypothetical protein LEN26_010766 [Aphanomyces euteiches]|nr:hypothetical protein AeMF1_015818 [Aphanomyces euteiches]KAH9121286.1 hypothetical protein LEN26_010766 [Aphanomyces euteiches]KAH9188742.1 hypothetical protein AeNC1_009284 [Aphanomyces euteiches]